MACRSEGAKGGLGQGQSEWVLDRCTVSEYGQPSCCDGRLQVHTCRGWMLICQQHSYGC